MIRWAASLRINFRIRIFAALKEKMNKKKEADWKRSA